jgi:putative tricarboxylic transport membrane protein
MRRNGETERVPPEGMRRLNLISGVFWLVVSIVAATESYRLRIGSFQKPGSGFLPFVAASVLGVLSLLIFLQSLLARDEREREDHWPNPQGWPKAAIVLMALLGYSFSVEKLGFLVTTFFLILFLLKTVGLQAWPKAILFSLLGSFFSYLLFCTGLKVPLPSGFLALAGF